MVKKAHTVGIVLLAVAIAAIVAKMQFLGFAGGNL